MKIYDEHKDRVKKVLKSKFNLGNMFQAINTWTVFLYGAGIVQWIKDELKQIDRKTRKLIALHCGMHPRPDVGRIYVERKKGSKSLMIVENIIDYDSHSLNKYTEISVMEMIQNSSELITTNEQDMSRSEYR